MERWAMKLAINHFIDNLIREAYYLRATDIHFQPTDDGVNILMRKQLRLSMQKLISTTYYEKIIRYIKFQTKLDISVKNRPQDGSFQRFVNGQKVFIRVSLIPLMALESIVMRLLPAQRSAAGEQLFYNQDHFGQMVKTITADNGLFIFTGPTGSGKTTAMYAVMESLQRQNKKVITIENPIEIINDRFVQFQVNEDLDLSFKTGLKAALRHDPDIIMIGEIRDEETARAVVRATLTGHKIITTMHTKNKYGVIERFLDFGFLKSEIASILIGITAQRLILRDDTLKIFVDLATDQKLANLIAGDRENDDITQLIEKAGGVDGPITTAKS